MNYGLPYKGSKNGIAEWVVSHLPKADVLYDLFCGGCAVTHAAMFSGKYSRFVINDIDPLMPQTFVKALQGGFDEEHRIINKETFHELKSSDPYVALCWSFGNKATTYLWGDDKSEIKLLASRMILAETLQERRKYFMQFIKMLSRLKNLQFLERLQSLERLERLREIKYTVQMPWGGDFILVLIFILATTKMCHCRMME